VDALHEGERIAVAVSLAIAALAKAFPASIEYDLTLRFPDGSTVGCGGVEHADDDLGGAQVVRGG